MPWVFLASTGESRPGRRERPVGRRRHPRRGRRAARAWTAHGRRFRGWSGRGEDGARDAQRAEQVVVPGGGVEVEQEGARGVGDVGGVDLASGELPEQPGVDGVEGEFAAGGAAEGAREDIEQSGEFRAAELRIEQESGARGRAVRGRGEAGGRRGCGAAVRPDEGGGEGAAGGPVPAQGGFALVGGPRSAPEAPVSLARAQAARAGRRVVAQRSARRCSTRTGCGKCGVNASRMEAWRRPR